MKTVFCSPRQRSVWFAFVLLAAVSAINLAAGASVSASEAAADPDAVSANAHELLLHGLRVTGLTAANGKPWHLKANYQLSQSGVPPESGTFEEWWTSPDEWRRTYATKNATATEWSVTRARHFQTRAAFAFALHDLRIARPLIEPLHQAANFKPEYPLDVKPLNAGLALNCVSMVNPNRYADGVDPDFLFPKFCFDASPLLRFLGTSDTTVTFNKYQLFQNRGVAYQVEVMVLGQKISSIDITLLEPLASDDEGLLKPAADAVPQPFAITAEGPTPVATYQVGAVIPFAAIHNHTLGRVLVPVLIEKDGRVKINGSPLGPRELAQPAADAIAHWRFEPYMIAGEPVEAATQVVYTFDGGPFVPRIGRPKTIPNSGYDPKRDPARDLELALAEARQAHKHVLIEIGGDWCIWCTYLDQFYADHPDLLALKQANYVTVKVNVSSENGNRAFLMPYPKFQGVPHMFVLDADGKLLQSQDTDNLEKGNGYNADRMREFLTKWKPS